MLPVDVVLKIRLAHEPLAALAADEPAPALRRMLHSGGGGNLKATDDTFTRARTLTPGGRGTCRGAGDPTHTLHLPAIRETSKLKHSIMYQRFREHLS